MKRMVPPSAQSQERPSSICARVRQRNPSGSRSSGSIPISSRWAAAHAGRSRSKSSGVAARKPVYEKIAARVLPDGGFLYLWHPQVLIARSDRLDGYTQMPDGLVRVIGLRLK